MTIYAGQNFLLEMSGDGEPLSWLTLGAARAVAVDVSNDLAETTQLGSGGAPSYSGAAGRRSMRVSLQGIFSNSSGEAALSAIALSGAARDYRLTFPNGDRYQGSFLAESYRREGSYDGFDMFSVSLLRSGEGTWTPA